MSENRTDPVTPDPRGNISGVDNLGVDGLGATVNGTSASVRERIMATAYELFSRHGVRGVSTDEIIARAGVAKSTLYKYFPSKNALVLAFLARREQAWTLEFVRDGACRRGAGPQEQLLAIFDVFHDWFHRDDFEGCSFINILAEMGPNDPLGQAAIDYLANIRTMVVRSLAQQAHLRDPEGFACCWHILMKGSIIAAAEGDTQAARRAQDMGRLLIARHRPAAWE
jgi:AcrR family transcriptional regulator